MKKQIRTMVACLVALCLMLTGAAAVVAEETPVVDYTYHTYSPALGKVWNPHTFETLVEQDYVFYLNSPLVTFSVLDSEESIYQWIYVGAESIVDVTADHQDDLTKYNISLPEGQTVEDTTEGYVFEIALNPELTWQDGTPINADTYIYSMQQMLNPQMHNLYANHFYDGDYSLAGADAYFHSGSPIYTALEDGFDLNAGVAAGTVYVNPRATLTMIPLAASMSSLINDYGLPAAAELDVITKAVNPYGYTKVTADNMDALKTVFGTCMAAFGTDWAGMDEAAQNQMMAPALVYNDGATSEVVDFANVGFYKVDEYTVRWVSHKRADYNGFLYFHSMDPFLVYEPLYEQGKDTTGALVTTDYGTDVDNTFSCGPYKLVSLQPGKQMVFEKNENFYLYEKDENGRLVATTDFLVDGEYVPAYETDRIVIDVMDADSAKQAFLKGELSYWLPAADDLSNYSTSDQLYRAPQASTNSIFFNCAEDHLKEMDKSKGNVNSVVFSNINFRKAFSLSIDRADYVKATPGYVPNYAFMTNAFYYDIYNNPASCYRTTDEAMQGICDLYGIEYGEGKIYPDLKSAYAAVNGYNLTEAQQLMKTACQELVDAGLYTAGEDIYVRVARSTGALTSDINQQMALLNKYINAAAEGSGFGTITLEAIGNITNLYDDVVNGEYAMGFGGWGGFPFEPFRNMTVYCDPERVSVQELGSWDPTATNLTLNVKGEDVTMTWQDWSNSLYSNGQYATEDVNVRLKILAELENNFLKLYYRIPLAATTNCYLLSYQCNEYTDEYNVIYGFGGIQLLNYNYTDAEWAEYVASEGGSLSYE